MGYEEIKNRPGFTLVEMMVTILISTIVVFGIGVVLVDSQRGWNRMYNRVYSDVVTDAYVARRAFDVTVRKASIKRRLIDGDGSAVQGSSVEVYYYDNLDSTELDRYATFSISGELLRVEHGAYDAETGDTTSDSTVTLARNVDADNSWFLAPDGGTCLHMVLALDNDSETMTVTSSAVRHNE